LLISVQADFLSIILISLRSSAAAKKCLPKSAGISGNGILVFLILENSGKPKKIKLN